MHVTVVGCGKIGQSLAMLLINEWYVTELTLVDIVPNLAKALAEDYKHAAAALKRDIKIRGLEKVEEVENADIIVVAAGSPRSADQSRRDLAVKNAGIIKGIAEKIFDNNRESWYLIITNPVDAMATLFYRITKSERVVGSGTHLDTLRFRSEIAKRLEVGVNQVEGFVAGEHGEAAVPLWSTVKVDGANLDEVLKKEDLEEFKNGVERSVKEVAAWIIKHTGATICGPVHAFRDIVRSILLNEGKVMSVATPYRIGEEEVHISLPSIVGKSIQPILLDRITEEENEKIKMAAIAVYRTFNQAVENLNLKAL